MSSNRVPQNINNRVINAHAAAYNRFAEGEREPLEVAMDGDKVLDVQPINPDWKKGNLAFLKEMAARSISRASMVDG